MLINETTYSIEMGKNLFTALAVTKRIRLKPVSVHSVKRKEKAQAFPYFCTRYEIAIRECLYIRGTENALSDRLFTV